MTWCKDLVAPGINVDDGHYTILTLSNLNKNINQWQVIHLLAFKHFEIAKVAYPTGTSRASIANFACHMK